MILHKTFIFITVLLLFGVPLSFELTPEVDVVIIGAGISGIAAGAHLLTKNFTNFIILEASNRIGGRVHTVPFGGGSIELGAEFIHGKDTNPVYEMASSLGLVSQIDNGRSTSLFLKKSDGTRLDPIVYRIISELKHTGLFHREEVVGNATSYGEFMEKMFWSSMEPLIAGGNVTRTAAKGLLEWVEKSFNPFDGSPSWYQTSVKDEFHMDDEPNNFFVVWKNGFNYSLIIDIITQRLPNKKHELPLQEKIYLNKEVTQVEWSGPTVEINCADGSHYKAKKVLTTVSLGILKDKVNTLFKPNLPVKKLQAIQGLGISSYDKICLEFPYRWWPPNVNEINFIWTAEQKTTFINTFDSWVTDLYGFSQSERLPLNVLCTMIGGPAAEKMEETSEREVKRLILLVLRMFFPSSVEIPEPLAILRTQWRKNPFTRGAYSYRHIDSDKLQVHPIDLAASVSNAAGEEVLLFAGEATDDKNYATVQGALLSGRKAAARII